MRSFKQVDPLALPMSLLLLADPSPEKVNAYLPGSLGFAAYEDDKVIGVCVVQPQHAQHYELMAIAVDDAYQKSGVGTQLLQFVVKMVGQMGVDLLEVGTGSFGYQLTFYQRQGFRVSAIDKDFFITHYKQAIFEDGIQLKDMLRLTYTF